ncbi:MAG TPA: methionine--tRNA ligase subunit beta, partial [Deltaproteobacteria bacterium]|nr:methionine--tRNA ligase subunit beta [Deltaproteobacteria bacterium]
PASLVVLRGCKMEPSVKDAPAYSRFQFERQGYFCVDPKATSPGRPVFNRTVQLRDTWAKIEKASAGKAAGPGSETAAEGKGASPSEGDHGVEAREITIEDFTKVDLRVGRVLEAHAVEGSDKLVRLLVDLGEPRPRNIVAGIRKAYPEPVGLVGKLVLVVANLRPRKMRSGLSEGMILAAGSGDHWRICTVDGDMSPGAKVS